MKFVLGLAALATSMALLAPTASHAQQRDELNASVRARDLDLATAQGRTALQERASTTVRSLCFEHRMRGLAARAQEQECLASASNSARDQIELAAASRQTRLAQRR